MFNIIVIYIIINGTKFYKCVNICLVTQLCLFNKREREIPNTQLFTILKQGIPVVCFSMN